jgi:hypothetical protein
MRYRFPDGLLEPVIATIIKEVRVGTATVACVALTGSHPPTAAVVAHYMRVVSKIEQTSSS